MYSARAPALVPCAVFLGSVALARTFVHLPVGSAALLCLLGLALRGRWGGGTAALGAGLLAVALAPTAALPAGALFRPVEVAGRVCSHEIRFGPRSAVELCADRLRLGAEVALGRWQLRLDLPEGATAPPLGARVRAVGQLGRTPGFENRFRSASGRLSLRVKSRRFLTGESAPPLALRWMARGRAALDAGWRRLGEERPGVALARALVLGDVSALPQRWARALRRTGLAHLTAVSGLNIALVAGWAAIAGALLPRPLRVALGAISALVYLGLVGPAPSMLRAAAMALVVAASLLAARAPLALQGLALVVIGLVAFDPDTLTDVGFLLSVTATAGLLIVTPPLERGLPLRPRLLARGLAASLAAQAAASPVSVATFGRLAPAAPLLNLIFGPWAALVLVLGLLAGGLGAVGADRWAAPWLWCLDRATLPLEWLTRLPPAAWVSTAMTPSWWCGAIAGVAFALPAFGRRGLRAGLLVALAAIGTAPPVAAARHFELAVLDVGQGDAILLSDGDRAALIDGGGVRGRDLAAHVLLPALAARGLDRLDLVVLSHFDDDHCRGLVDLAGQIPFDELWLPRGAAPTACSRELAASPIGSVRGVAAGDLRRLGALQLEVLAPEAGPAARSDNALSLVIRAEGGGRSALLLGDLDGGGERRLARRFGAALRSDLLKVAHHGSASSTTPELLASVRPRLAIASAGSRNPYGHPSARALSRLTAAGIPVLRTDRDGGVEVRWGAAGPWRIALPGSPRRETGRGG